LIGLKKVYPATDKTPARVVSFREKTVENILKGIEQSKSVPFPRVLYALGIRYVGETVARKLALHYHSIDRLMQASFEELILVDEIGEKIAESIVKTLHQPEMKEIIEELKKAGVQMSLSVEEKQTQGNILAGKTFVVSGDFGSAERRREIEQMVVNNGGKLGTSVSSKTSFIVAGSQMGPSKKQKAIELGIPLLNEQEFLDLLGKSHP